MPKIGTRLILLLFLAMLWITACGGQEDFDQQVAAVVAQTQTAENPDSQLGPHATEALSSDSTSREYHPLAERDCSTLQAALSQATGIDGSLTTPFPFQDYLNEKGGQGCFISLAIRGSASNDNSDLSAKARSVLENDGWIEDAQYAAAGAGGIALGYRKGDQLCLVTSYVEPTEGTCDANEPFFACMDRLPPEQIRYGFDLNCAQILP